MPLRRPIATLLLLGLLPCGCGEEPATGTAMVSLSWTMVDGRSCPDSGVERVVVREEGTAKLLMDALCPTGHEARAVEVKLPAGARTYQVEGRSAQATPLYSRRLELELEDGEQRQVKVQLIFVGGR